MTSNAIVQKLWNYCNILRDDGLSYQDYIEQLKGMRRTTSAGSKTVGSKPAKRSLNPDVVVTMTSSTRESIAASEKKSPGSVPGKILEFATRMRQSRGREVLLNA